MSRLGIDAFTRFFIHYKDLPHQRLAVATLWKALPVSLLEEEADWVTIYRDPAVEEEPEVPVVLPGKDPELSWGSVLAMAKKAGAKYPEVAAAQCVLESGWFQHETGAYNVLGIKAAGNEPFSWCTTQEEIDGKFVTIQDKFKDFDSYEDCIKQLVEQWYLDYRGYTGVNAARSVGECCQMLVHEGYATDSQYAAKLMSIINRQS